MKEAIRDVEVIAHGDVAAYHGALSGSELDIDTVGPDGNRPEETVRRYARVEIVNLG
jgi:hypothetical protein